MVSSPPKSEQVRFPIIRDTDGHAWVQCVLGDNYRFDGLVDTGCTGISLTRDLIKRARLKQVGKAQTATSGGIAQVGVYQCWQIQSGDYCLNDIQVTDHQAGVCLLGQAFWGGGPLTIGEDFIEFPKPENADMAETKQRTRESVQADLQKVNDRLEVLAKEMAQTEQIADLAKREKAQKEIRAEGKKLAKEYETLTDELTALSRAEKVEPPTDKKRSGKVRFRPGRRNRDEDDEPDYQPPSEGKSDKGGGRLKRWASGVGGRIGKDERKVKVFLVLLNLLRLGIFIGVIFACYLNIKPYQAVVAQATGWGGESGITRVVGFALWGILQILQLLPSLISSNGPIITAIGLGLKVLSDIASKGDHPEVAEMKRKLNMRKHNFYTTFKRLRLFGYGVDFALCIWRYPPFPLGLATIPVFFSGALSLQRDIRWDHVLLTIFAMFFLEFILWIAGLVAILLEIVEKGMERQQSAPNN